MQATMASDFAIAQFRFLTPLLLVHGRLSYKRITRMISFFFYKNLFYGSTIFIYNAFALFSGQPIYNDFYMTLFNVVFTAAAPLVVGWFDRDLDKDLGLRFPFLYHEGEQPGMLLLGSNTYACLAMCDLTCHGDRGALL
jgi:phospholipid-transporting ATPase